MEAVVKIELEVRTTMSRAETFKALQIALDAAERLKHRMTDRELEKLSECGAALIGLANGECAHRKGRVQNLDTAKQKNRIAAGPPLIEGIAQ